MMRKEEKEKGAYFLHDLCDDVIYGMAWHAFLIYPQSSFHSIPFHETNPAKKERERAKKEEKVVSSHTPTSLQFSLRLVPEHMNLYYCRFIFV